MEIKDKTILIISPESWGINFVSKHHYASILSEKNNVFFLNPPSKKLKTQTYNPNLTIVDYYPVVRGTNRMPAFLRNFFNRITMSRIKKLCQIKKIDIVWSFDPFRFQNLLQFDVQIRIYHPVDVHSTYLENEIAKTATLILTSNEVIKRKLEKLNKNIFNIGHGLSNEFLANVNTTEISRLEDKLRICMMGNFQRKIDFELLYTIIEQNPVCSFHFIGPTEKNNLSSLEEKSKEILQLKNFDNTVFYGPISSNQLPELLYKMDVFLILYEKEENPAALANPHKVLEFLSTGKVVLSTFLSEYQTRSHLLVMSEKNEFLNKFNDIIKNLTHYNSIEKMEERKNYAKENSYELKLRKISELIYG